LFVIESKEVPMGQNTTSQPVEGMETRVKQAGPPRITLWVLLASVLLAALVGAMLLTNTDEYPPSTQRNPVENAPVSGSQPTAPQAPASPQQTPTRQ
jgi:hypothetical protein